MIKAVNILSLYVLLFFFMILGINHMVLLLPGDDYLYSMQFPEEGYPGTERINSISDFWSSCLHHYQNYNNRIIPHAILQAVLLLPAIVFDIINSLLFMLIPFLVIQKKKHESWSSILNPYIVSLCLIWLFHPDLGRAYFWTSGSLNYTWFLVPQLYFTFSLAEKWEGTRTFRPADVFIALLIATSSEPVVLCLFIFSILVLIGCWLKHRHTDTCLLFSTLVLLAGGLVMLKSPALMERFSSVSGVAEGYTIAFKENLYRAGIYILLCLSGGVVLLTGGEFARGRKTSVLIGSMIIFLLVLMLFTPLFEPRSAAFPFILSLCFFNSLIRSYLNPGLVTVLVVVAATLVIPQRWRMSTELIANTRFNIEKLQSVQADSVWLDRICFPAFSRAIPCENIYSDAGHLHNRSLAAFYDKEYVGLHEAGPCIPDTGSAFLVSIPGNPTTTGTQVTSIYYQKSNGGMCLLLEMNKALVNGDQDLILRGARKGIWNGLLEILPLNYRHYFMDYLEEGLRPTTIEGSTFYQIIIDHPGDYKYFILSAYSKKTHSAKGESYYIKNPMK